MNLCYHSLPELIAYYPEKKGERFEVPVDILERMIWDAQHDDPQGVHHFGIPETECVFHDHKKETR